jgi:hypothetical protein
LTNLCSDADIVTGPLAPAASVAAAQREASAST